MAVDNAIAAQIGQGQQNNNSMAMLMQMMQLQKMRDYQNALEQSQASGQQQTWAPAAALPEMQGPPQANGSGPRPGYFASGDITNMIHGVADKYGIPRDAFMRMAGIENPKFDPYAVSPTGATGLFQFTRGTAGQYGLTDRTDPYANADAAGRLWIDNQNSLRKSLGRDPTPGEIYLAHQQGAGGASALLRNPNMPALDVLSGAYGGDITKAMQAITVNGGQPNWTAGQFANRWVSRF